jgi:hypothetical protein
MSLDPKSPHAALSLRKAAHRQKHRPLRGALAQRAGIPRNEPGLKSPQAALSLRKAAHRQKHQPLRGAPAQRAGFTHGRTRVQGEPTQMLTSRSIA